MAHLFRKPHIRMFGIRHEEFDPRPLDGLATFQPTICSFININTLDFLMPQFTFKMTSKYSETSFLSPSQERERLDFLTFWQ